MDLFGTNMNEITQPIGFFKTTYDNEHQLLNDLLFVYNEANPIDVDVCFSKGSLWKGLPDPIQKFDISPVVDNCKQADMRSLPLESSSVKSIFCDPPFVIGMPSEKAKSESIISNRFSGFRNMAELKGLYSEALIEFKRVVVKSGLIVFKCQDTVTHDRQFLSHVFISNECQRIGLCVEDIIILVRNRAIIDPAWKKQNHARKTHCYYMVIRNFETKTEHKTIHT